MPMKFDRPRCPKCWAYAAGIVELVPVFARLSFDPDEDDVDTTEYACESEVCWDGQCPVNPDDQYTMAPNTQPPRVMLWCEACNHRWQSGVDWLDAFERDVFHPGGADCESKA